MARIFRFWNNAKWNIGSVAAATTREICDGRGERLENVVGPFQLQKGIRKEVGIFVREKMQDGRMTPSRKWLTKQWKREKTISNNNKIKL